MPSETEIERLVVRLIGEDSSFQKMMDRAVKEGQKLERQAQQAARAEDTLNEAMRQGAAVTKAVETDLERYNRTLQEMSNLYNKGAISLTTFNRVMQQHEQLLPEFANAAMKQQAAEKSRQDLMARGQGLTREMRTDLERYNDRVDELHKMLGAGAISQTTYNRSMEALRQTLPHNIELERMRQDALRRAASLTDAVMTPQERYRKSIQEVSQLHKEGLITQETYQRSIKQSASVLRLAGNETTEFASRLTGLGSQLLIVGGVAAGTFGGLAYGAVNAAKEFEGTMISFEAMLGSQSKAQKLLGDLRQFAAKTPFELPMLLETTKTLLQFQVPAEEVLGILKNIGDVTGGQDPNKVRLMTLAFSQMTSAGRLMGQDLMQMVNAGFNPLNEISKKTGKSMMQLREEMSQGQITAGMVKEAFEAASGKLNLMEKQSASLAGRQSTLTDEFKNFVLTLGQQLLPLAGKLVDVGADLVKWLNALSPSTKAAIAYGTVFAAGLGTLIVSSGGLLLTLGSLTASYGSLTTAMGISIPVMTLEASVVSGLASATGAATTATVGLSLAQKMLIGGGVVAALGAIGAAAYYVYSSNKDVQDLNRSLEKTATLTDKVAGRIGRQTTGTIGESRQITEQAPREVFLTGEIAKAEKELQGYQAAVSASRREVAALEPTWLSAWQAGKAAYEVAKSDLADHNKLLDEGKKKVQALKDELLRQSGQSAIDAEVTKIEKTTKDVERQLYFANAKLKELVKLAVEFGDVEGSGELARDAQAAAEKVKALRDQLAGLGERKDVVVNLQVKLKEDVNNELTKFIADVEQKLRGLGKTPEQAKLDELGRQGVKEEQLAPVRRKVEMLQAGEDRAKFLHQMDQEIQKLQQEQELWGLVGAAAEIAKLELEAANIVGADPQAAQAVSEQLMKLKEMFVARDVAQAQKEKESKELAIAEDVKKLTEQLQEQVETFGMSQDAILLYRLGLKLVGREQIEQVRLLQEQIKVLNKNKDLADRAKQVIEALKTPMQLQQEKKNELKEVFDAGLLSADQYRAALKKIEEQGIKTGQELKKAMGVDAAQFGSAEALARINAALEGGGRGFSQVATRNPPAGLLPDVPAPPRQVAAAQRRLDLAANDLLPERLRVPVAPTAQDRIARAGDSMLPARLQSQNGPMDFNLGRKNPELDEGRMVGVEKNGEKGLDRVAEGVMLLVDLTRQLVGKEPVLFEEADIR